MTHTKLFSCFNMFDNLLWAFSNKAGELVIIVFNKRAVAASHSAQSLVRLKTTPSKNRDGLSS